MYIGAKFMDLKITLLKLCFNTTLFSDSSLKFTDRVEYFFKSFVTFAPVAFILNSLQLWFNNYSGFITGLLFIIFINMLVGGFMHYRKKSFNWGIFIKKTTEMMIVTSIPYIVLEIIITRSSDNLIIEGFRVALQIATLLYPGGKILKNIFILSKGQHPPKWVMERIYNFQNNGDLKELMHPRESSNN